MWVSQCGHETHGQGGLGQRGRELGPAHEDLLAEQRRQVHRPFRAKAFRVARSVSPAFAARMRRAPIMLRSDACATRSMPTGDVASNSVHASSNNCRKSTNPPRANARSYILAPPNASSVLKLRTVL